MILKHNIMIVSFLVITSLADVTIDGTGWSGFVGSSLRRHNLSTTLTGSTRYTEIRTSSKSTNNSSAISVKSSSPVVYSSKYSSTLSNTSFTSVTSSQSTTTPRITLSAPSTVSNSSTTTSTPGGGPPGGGPHGGGHHGGGHHGGGHHGGGHHGGGHHGGGAPGGGPPGGGPPGGGPPGGDPPGGSSTDKKSSTRSETTSSSDTSTSTSSSTASACPLPHKSTSTVTSTTSVHPMALRDLLPTEAPVAGEHNLVKRRKTKASFTKIVRQDPSSVCILHTAIKYPNYPGPAHVTVYEAMPTPRLPLLQNILDTMPRWYVARQDPDPLALPAFTVVDTAGLAAAGPGGSPVAVGGSSDSYVNIDHICRSSLTSLVTIYPY